MPFNQPGGGYNGGYGSAAGGAGGGRSTGSTSGGQQLSQAQKNKRTAADVVSMTEAAHNEGSLAGPTGSMGTQGGNETRTGGQMRATQGDGGGKQTQGPSGPTYDNTGRLVSDGSVPSVPNASLGQKIGLFAGLLPGGMLNSAPDVYGAVTDPSAPPRGGFVGMGIDSLTGETPGRIEGSVPNRVASNTQTRGDRPSDGSDYGIADSAGASIGDSPDLTGAAATDYLYSDVQLEDRRKYKPVGAGTAMAMGLG